MADVAPLRHRIEKRAGELAPRLCRSPRPMVVSTITNNHFLPVSGWSLQVDPVKYKIKRYTPNEGVRGPDRVALTARSDRAVTNDGTAIVYIWRVDCRRALFSQDTF
eukprot:6107679-Pleurochrysis_carterae.AAC.1